MVVALIGGAAFGAVVAVLARYVPTSARGLEKPATEPWHMGLMLGALAALAVAGLILFASVHGIQAATAGRDGDAPDDRAQ